MTGGRAWWPGPLSRRDNARHRRRSDFWAAAEAGNLPAVSFLKAPCYQQGGIGPSGPLLEQQYIVDLVNRLEKLRSWNSTAVVVMYADSDGGYDHVMPPILNDSQTSDDALTGPRAVRDLPRSSAAIRGAADTGRVSRCTSSRPGPASTTSIKP